GGKEHPAAEIQTVTSTGRPGGFSRTPRPAPFQESPTPTLVKPKRKPKGAKEAMTASFWDISYYCRDCRRGRGRGGCSRKHTPRASGQRPDGQHRRPHAARRRDAALRTPSG